MLSNKLTFSLASLIVLLMIAICMSADAQRIQATTVITLPVTDTHATTGTTVNVIDKETFVVFGVGAANGAPADMGLDLAGSPKIVGHTFTKGGYIASGSVLTTTAEAGTTVHPTTDTPQKTNVAPTGSDGVLAAGIDVDLEEFFRLGGTIELIAPADGDDEAYVGDPISHLKLGKYDLVISEVMWALDVHPDALLDDRKQWIEIYNTMGGNTKAITDHAGYTANSEAITTTVDNSGGRLKLRFVPYWHIERPGDIIKASAGITANGGAPGERNPAVKHVILDSVSNLQFVRWEVHGENGNTTIPGAGTANFRFSDPPLKPLVSMYRNLDYVKIHGTHALTGNRAKQLEGVPDGALPDGWKATPVLGRRNTSDQYHVATPGARHVMDVVHIGVTKTSIPSDTVVINEVRNDTSASNIDWVELYNTGTEPVDLHGWELSLIDATHAPIHPPDPDADTDKHASTDTMLVGKEDGGDDEDRFPAGADWKLEAGEYLLIVNRHPRETVLANGVNIDEVAEGREVKAGASHQYIVRPKLNLPDANITLILRDHLEKNTTHKGVNKDDAKKRALTDITPSTNIKDYAGNLAFEVKTDAYNTLVWPFRGWTKAAGTDGKDGEAIPNNATQAHARKRYQVDDGHHKDAWDQIGAKGGLGYDRGVDLKYAPGTPGYANDSIRGALIDDKATRVTTDDVIYNGEVTISEVMYDAGPRWHLIQWVELYNSSMDETINLKDWRFDIFNAKDDVESYVDSGFDFNDAFILPNQALLIVSGSGTNDVSPNRVYNLYQHHRRDLGLTNRRSVLLSPSGFYLRLTDKNGDAVDEAGNVVVKGSTREIMWELPARNPEYRQSLVRQFGSRELYDGTADPADDGTMMESWVQSDLIDAGIAFYGHRDDVGTPGYRLGGPLPVSLSKFRPLRNQDTGHVDIQWITESELNNAGFNILRSVAKNGAFKVINVKGIIAGHGTTSEQHVYKFTDATAKPNVVYYYQIEDVSINGLRTTLTTTHLRGHVGAGGKLTITWGDLKLQK